MSDTKLNEREERILQAVVHTYVTSAEAVGSRTIVKRFDLGLSPATVRNVMSDLEDHGFLQQLHTSSGRVPTDLGYRYFVDYLMKVQELTAAEQVRIERELSAALNDADEIMRQTSHLLALVSHQTGLVEAPTEADTRVQRIELLPVSDSRVAILVIDDYGRVRTVVASPRDPFTRDDLTSVARYLNETLVGVSLAGIVEKARAEMMRLLDENRRIAEKALDMLRLVPPPRPGQLFLDGAVQLFEQPEFSDVAKAREVFSLLEERETLAELLRCQLRDRDPSRPWVVIGSECKAEGLEEMSLIVAPYRVGDRAVGAIGVLGPRRMPYSKLTSLVSHTAGRLSRFLTRLVG